MNYYLKQNTSNVLRSLKHKEIKCMTTIPQRIEWRNGSIQL